MSPPKQDAFADLFRSANSNPSKASKQNLPLQERQRQQVSQKSDADNDIWSSFESLSVNNPKGGLRGEGSGYGGAGGQKGQQDLEDLFSVFDKPNEAKTQVEVGNGQNGIGGTERTFAGGSISSHVQQQSSLLDDDFIDAFPQQTGSIDPPTAVDSPRRRPQTVKRAGLGTLAAQDDEKDETLAGLVDIGFSVEDSNRAIGEVGPDLQSCVNYLMKGMNSKDKQSNQSTSHVQNGNDLLNGSFNEISNEFLSKATSFFNKSKQTVMKNLEQFQQKQHDGNDASLPAWMRTQSQYKADAVERKSGAEIEDYGSDDENIDQQKIHEFMRKQKEKERERQKLRYDNLKNAAVNKIASGRTSPVKRPDLPKRPSSQPQIQATPDTQIKNRPHTQHPYDRKPPVEPKTMVKQEIPKDVDLLGLSSSNATYPGNSETSSSGNSILTNGTSKSKKNVTSEPLNEFLRSDYDTSKSKAGELFASGDYDGSYAHYLKCLDVLPPKHELRVVIYSNLTLTLCKIGNFKEAKDLSIEGLDLLKGEELNDTSLTISNKSLKTWYIKLLSRKAESLEMLEAFPESLECYVELIKLGASDKKIMDGKRRVNNIVNPPPKVPKPAASTTRKPTSSRSASPSKPRPASSGEGQNLKNFKSRDASEKKEELERLRLQESVDQSLATWSNGNEENIRALLTTLPSVLPQRLGFPFLTTKPITLGDIMLPKKVKLAYMKVIGSIHPDKSGSLPTEDKMLCQGVFIILNKSWDKFKEQNGMN